MRPKGVFVFIVLFVLLVLLFPGCDSSQPSSTPTFTPTLCQATPTPCPEVTPFSPQLPSSRGRMIVILIDRSGSYEEFLPKVLDVVRELVGNPKYLQPGDTIYIGWIGDSRLVNESSEDLFFVKQHIKIIPPPHFLSFTPTPPPNNNGSCYTPTPVESPVSVVGQAAASKRARATVQACRRQIQEHQCLYAAQYSEVSCANFDNNRKNVSNFQEWKEEQQNILKTASETMSEQVQNILNELPDNASDTFLLDALTVMTRYIRYHQDIGNYESYHLVIFSDMEDTGSVVDNEKVLVVTDMHILIAGVPCDDVRECEDKKRQWRSYFEAYRRFNFLSVIETNAEIIAHLLREP